MLGASARMVKMNVESDGSFELITMTIDHVEECSVSYLSSPVI